MFEIREVENVDATKGVSAIQAATPWLFVIWTCICFGC